MSARLLIAVADDETARRAAAQAREAEMEVVDIAAEVDELHRALRRLDVDVVLLYDALGGTPVLDLARDLAVGVPRGRADPARRRRHARAAARGDAGRPARRRRAPALARVLRVQRPRRRAVVADDARPRRGRGVRGRRARRPARRRRRLQGRRRHDHDRAAPRARRGPDGAGPPDLPGRLRPPEGRFPRAAGHAAPAQRRRPRRGRARDLRPPPAGDALHAQGGLPAAARARGGRARRGRRLRRRPQRPGRGQGAPRADDRRHRRGRDRGDRDRGRDGRAWWSSSPRPDVLALRGVRRMRDLWKRLSVREDEDVADRAQPRVPAARDPARPGAQGRRRHDGPDDDPGRLQRARGGGQHGLAEPAGGQQAARRLRGAGHRAGHRPAAPRRPPARDDEPRGLLARLGGERGQTHGRVHGPVAGRAGRSSSRSGRSR